MKSQTSPTLHIPDFKTHQRGLIFLMLCCLWRKHLKGGRMGNGKPPSGFALLKLVFHIETLVPLEFSTFRARQHTKIGDWWNRWFFFQKNWKRVMWEGRWKGKLQDDLTAHTYSGLLTLGTLSYGSWGSDIALLKTIHIHMTLGKFSCNPIHKDYCSRKGNRGQKS